MGLGSFTKEGEQCSYFQRRGRQGPWGPWDQYLEGPYQPLALLLQDSSLSVGSSCDMRLHPV